MSTTFPEEDIDLNDGWRLTREGGDEAVVINFPCDVHSALLDAGLIEDPYWRDRETSLDWVHESEWLAERDFDCAIPGEGPLLLSLDGVDCHAIVSVNDVEVGKTANQFRRYEFDIGAAAVSGTNRLTIRFLSNSKAAQDAAEAFPFPVPYLDWMNRIGHMNFLRKTQCDGGWDWNIALSPLGIRGGVVLRRPGIIDLRDVSLRQIHEAGRVTVQATLFAHVLVPTETTAVLRIDGTEAVAEVLLYPGDARVSVSVAIDSPRLWWPRGHGDQALYDLEVELAGITRQMKIGLREIELVTEPDEIGSRFAFRVNGRDIFARGVNWIPADALPSRATPDVVADLLDSAVDANMNMLRIWGGGTYEPDWFYRMCSERGLMIWQDFMFACNLYPAADRAWLENIRAEARQQVRRLSQHPCVAVWCGDNELVGAIGWFKESQKDRGRYLAMYDRLNHALEEIVEDEATGISWWPSSPTAERLDFGDTRRGNQGSDVHFAHDDTRGDMHFWDVWHASKDFEHYRTVQPRFCSEFGFQSFPSPTLIKTFTEEEDRNVSSPVMGIHQRNPGGNGRIIETMARYFRFPDDFDEMCWLSQVSQALAMKTAIEFWRSSKPRCMGTLYWQLNDTWPVASWSSVEYGGAWNLTQYVARRFYAPVLVTAQPDGQTGEIVVLAVNDTGVPISLETTARRVDVSGPMADLGEWATLCPPEGAVEIARLPGDCLGPQEFLHLQWCDVERVHSGENEYLPRRPKEYRLPTPTISVARSGDDVTLTTDVPALFVTYDHGGADVLSDNCFTLLPDAPKVLKVSRKRAGSAGTGTVQWLRG